MSRAEARQDPVRVKVTPDVDRDFATETRRRVRVALADLDAQVNLDPNLSRSFRRDVEKLARTALAAAKVEVKVDAVLGRRFRADLNKSILAATKGADIEVPVTARLASGFVAKLRRQVREALVASPIEANVDMRIDRRSFATFTADLVERARVAAGVASQAAVVAPVADTTRFAADLLASVGANVRAVGASDAADVTVGADLSQFTAETAAGVVAAQETLRAAGLGDVVLGVDATKFDAELLAKVGASIRAFSGTDLADIDVGVDVGPAVAELAVLGTAADGTGRKLGLIGKGIAIGAVAGLAGLLTAAAGAFAVAIKKTSDFDAELSNLNAVADVTAGQLGELREQALLAGRDTVFSASEAAQAQTELAKAGVAAADILGGGLPAALALASAGELELADAATFVATGLNVFQLEAEDASRVADTLAAAANKSAADVGDIGIAFSQSALVAKQFGLSIEDTAGTLALFAQNALRGSDAGTSLRTMLLRLNPQSKEAAGTMADLGLKFYDASGAFVGIEEVAGQLQKGLAGLTKQQRDAALLTIFGQDAIRGANILYEQGAAGVAKWTEGVTESGFAAEVAGKKLDNLKGDVENLRGSLETVFITAGQGQTGGLRSIVQGLTEIVNTAGPGLAAAIAPIGTLLSTIAPMLAAFTGALLPAMEGLGVVATPIITALLGLTTDLLTALAPVFDSLAPLADTFAILVAAVSPLLDVLGTIVSVVAETVTPIFQGLAEALVPVVALFAEGMTGALDRLGPVLETVGGLLGDVLREIGPVLATVLTETMRELEPLLPDIADATVELAAAFADLLTAVLPIIPPLAQFVTRFLIAPNVKILVALADAASKLMGALAPFAGVLVGAFVVAKVIGAMSAIGIGLGNLQRNFAVASARIRGDAGGVSAGLVAIKDAAAKTTLAGTGFGSTLVAGADKARTAFDRVRGAVEKAGGGMTVFKGVAFGVAAAVSGYFAAMSDDVSGQVLGLLGTVGSVAGAFALGGPIVGGIAAVAAGIGAVFGAIQKGSRDAAAQVAEDLARTKAIAEDFFTAFKTAGFETPVQRANAALDVFRGAIEKNEKPARDFFTRFNVDVGEAAIRLSQGTDEFKEFAESIIDSRIDEALDGNKRTLLIFRDEVHEASQNMVDDLDAALGSRTTGALRQSVEDLGVGVETGAIKIGELGGKLRDLGFSQEEASVVIGNLRGDIETLIRTSDGAEFGITLSEGTRDAITQMQELQRITELTKTAADRSKDAFTEFDRAVGDATTGFRNFIDEANGATPTLVDASLTAIGFAEQMIELNKRIAQGGADGSKALLEQKALVFSTQGELSGVLGRLAGEAGGNYELFTQKVEATALTMAAQIHEQTGLSIADAQAVVAQVLAVPNKDIFIKIADEQKLKDGLAGVHRQVVDIPSFKEIQILLKFDTEAFAPGSRRQVGNPWSEIDELLFGPPGAEGRLITVPTLMVAGEAGPELLLPLTNRRRMLELLREAGVLEPLPVAVTPVVTLDGVPGPVLPPMLPRPPERPRVPVVGFKGDTAALSDWVDTSVGLFGKLEKEIQGFVDRTTFTLAHWASVRLPEATVQPLLEWERKVRFITAMAAADFGAVASAAAAAADVPAPAGAADELNDFVRGLFRSGGGVVPGPRVDRDIVPALLTPGEVVIRAASVRRFGLDELLDLNRGLVPAGWVVPRKFREGGLVPASAEVARYADAVAPIVNYAAPLIEAPDVLVSVLHDSGRAARIVELARQAPTLPERARDLAAQVTVLTPQQRGAETSDERPVGDAVQRSLDRFERRSLAILAAAMDNRPLIGELNQYGTAADPNRNAAALVREVQAARWRSGT